MKVQNKQPNDERFYLNFIPFLPTYRAAPTTTNDFTSTPFQSLTTTKYANDCCCFSNRSLVSPSALKSCFGDTSLSRCKNDFHDFPYSYGLEAVRYNCWIKASRLIDGSS